ncbi:allantoate deiminase 2, partial [Quercus suber]
LCYDDDDDDGNDLFIEDGEISSRNDLFREILRDEAVARLNELGKDTVVDAGIYDGSLGIISALSALKVLNVNGTLGKLRRPIEANSVLSSIVFTALQSDSDMTMNFLLLQVIAFSDEEGVRFHSTFLGSVALAGGLPVTALQISDKSARCPEGKLPRIYRGKLVIAQVHIEQGLVLEWLGFPLGVVKGIAGQTRLKIYKFLPVTVRGSQGHAGTVPMSMHQDPMAAAAELIVLLESACKNPKDFPSYDGHCNDISLEPLSSSLVCAVGEISTWPSASNVIPGQHDANAVVCDSELSSQLKSAAYSALRKMASNIQDETPALMSGAGHDAMAMSHLTKVCPILLRPQLFGGHSPVEHVLDEDVWAASLAILAFLETQL